jgi:hypothetical protein
VTDGACVSGGPVFGFMRSKSSAGAQIPFRSFKPHNLLTAWSAAGHLEGKQQFQLHATRFV